MKPLSTGCSNGPGSVGRGLEQEAQGVLDTSELTNRRAALVHVLYFDIVKYTDKRAEQQAELVEEINHIISETSAFQRAKGQKQVLLLPSGDSSAVVFLQDPASPARCALQIARAILTRPHIEIRMGINSGPVEWVTIAGNEIVAGPAINYAQRAASCGDARHILITEATACFLLEFKAWAKYIVDLGEFEVKHGKKIHIYNLCAGNLGNSVPPTPQRQVVPAPSPKATSDIPPQNAIRRGLELIKHWRGSEPRQAKQGEKTNGRRLRLYCLSGEFFGQEVEVPPQGLIIGRKPKQANLVISSNSVSAAHARVWPDASGQGLMIEDLKSTNGTFYAESVRSASRPEWVEVRGPKLLKVGARFRLGEECAEFEVV